MDDSSIPENYENEKSETKLPMGLAIGALVLSVLAIVFAYSSKNSLGRDVETQTLALEEFREDVNRNLADFASKSGAERIDRLEARLASLENKVNLGFEDISNAIKNMEQDMQKIAAGRRASAGANNSQPAVGTPVVAGDGEYVIAKGDNPTVIAKKIGCTVSELMAVNPGLDPKKLRIGQKLKVPTK